MEAKLKHLELIQAVIGRMAQNSFLFKGWAITLAAGLSALGAVNTKHALLAISLITTLMFWALDGYYLWLERCFISLYANVAAADEAAIDFRMAIDKACAVRKWTAACLRPHLLLFYGTIIVAEVIGIFVVHGGK